MKEIILNFCIFLLKKNKRLEKMKQIDQILYEKSISINSVLTTNQIINPTKNNEKWNKLIQSIQKIHPNYIEPPRIFQNMLKNS